MPDESKSSGRPRRYFDATINLQTVVSSILGAGLAMIFAYFAVVGRVSTLELRADQLEKDQRQQRADVKDQVKDMRDEVMGVAGDVKEILRYLRDSGTANRPELKRWTK